MACTARRAPCQPAACCRAFCARRRLRADRVLRRSAQRRAGALCGRNRQASRWVAVAVHLGLRGHPGRLDAGSHEPIDCEGAAVPACVDEVQLAFASPQILAGATLSAVRRDMAGGSKVRSIVRTSTPIWAGSVQPATSYGRSGRRAAWRACAGIVLAFEQRLDVSAIRLREQDDVAARRIRLAVGAKRLERAMDFDAALQEQFFELAAARGSCCSGGMTNANGPPARPRSTARRPMSKKFRTIAPCSVAAARAVRARRSGRSRRCREASSARRATDRDRRPTVGRPGRFACGARVTASARSCILRSPPRSAGRRCCGRAAPNPRIPASSSRTARSRPRPNGRRARARAPSRRRAARLRAR